MTPGALCYVPPSLINVNEPLIAPPPTHTHSQYSPFMTGVMRYLRHGYALSASRTHWYFSATSSSIIRFRRETLNSVASPTDAFHGESMSMNNMSLSQAT